MSGALLALTSRAAKSFEMIIISRVLIGINSGMSFSLTCYISISPVVDCSENWTKLRHWRLFAVCFAGISMNVQPMYFGESAPKHLRGAISLSSAVFTSFGVVLGQVVGLRCGHCLTSFCPNGPILYCKTRTIWVVDYVSTVTLWIFCFKRDFGQRVLLALSSCQ